MISGVIAGSLAEAAEVAGDDVGEREGDEVEPRGVARHEGRRGEGADEEVTARRSRVEGEREAEGDGGEGLAEGAEGEVLPRRPEREDEGGEAGGHRRRG